MERRHARQHKRGRSEDVLFAGRAAKKGGETYKKEGTNKQSVSVPRPMVPRWLMAHSPSITGSRGGNIGLQQPSPQDPWYTRSQVVESGACDRASAHSIVSEREPNLPLGPFHLPRLRTPSSIPSFFVRTVRKPPRLSGRSTAQTRACRRSGTCLHRKRYAEGGTYASARNSERRARRPVPR